MTDINWDLQLVNIRTLRENPRNPRQINKQAIENLGCFIEKFGLIDKPIINQNHTIIGGHQRIRLLKRQKVKSVQCWMPNRLLDDKEIDEMCIGLNLHQGQWDWDILANNYDVLDLLQYGFSEEQLLGHAEDAKEVEGDQKENATEEKNKKSNVCPNCGFEC